MLCRMDGTIDAEDLLSGGNWRVVNPAGAKDIEPGAEAGAGEERKARAACSTMQIQAESGTESADIRGSGRKKRVDLRIALEDVPETIFHNDGHAKIGPVRFQQMQGGSGKDAISE